MFLPSLRVALKYYSELGESKKLANHLITQLYSMLDYEDKDLELEIIKNYPSRAEGPVALQTLSIFRANLEDGASPPIKSTHMAAYNRIIYKKASIGDDFTDDVFVRYLAERRGWKVIKVYSLIRDRNFLLKLGKLQVPYYDERFKRRVHPLWLIRGAFNLGDHYEELLGDVSQSALQTFKRYEKEVWYYQAIDVAIGASMRKGNIKSTLKIVREHLSDEILRLTDKLALISEGIVKIVNPIAAIGNERHPEEETTPPLSEFYRAITRFSQLAIDDIGMIERDIEEKAGNVFIIDMLRHGYSDVTLTNFKDYVRKVKTPLSPLLLPPFRTAVDELLRLRGLNFAYEDSRLALELMFNKARSKSKTFNRKYHVEDRWYEEAEKLIKEKLR